MLNIKRVKYIVHAHENKIQHSKLSAVFIIKCFNNNYKCILHRLQKSVTNIYINVMRSFLYLFVLSIN